MSMGHTEKKQFIDKEIIDQKSSYGSDVACGTYSPSLHHPETSWIYLTPLLGTSFIDGPFI